MIINFFINLSDSIPLNFIFLLENLKRTKIDFFLN
jgi:hypothetical protein